MTSMEIRISIALYPSELQLFFYYIYKEFKVS